MKLVNVSYADRTGAILTVLGARIYGSSVGASGSTLLEGGAGSPRVARGSKSMPSKTGMSESRPSRAAVQAVRSLYCDMASRKTCDQLSVTRVASEKVAILTVSNGRSVYSQSSSATGLPCGRKRARKGVKDEDSWMDLVDRAWSQYCPAEVSPSNKIQRR
jgi:hypothetical protein